jgi:hypothetical protein
LREPRYRHGHGGTPSVPAWFAMMRWCEITNRRRHGPPDHHLE